MEKMVSVAAAEKRDIVRRRNKQQVKLSDLQQTREPEQRIHSSEIIEYLHGKQTDDVHLQTHASVSC